MTLRQYDTQTGGPSNFSSPTIPEHTAPTTANTAANTAKITQLNLHLPFPVCLPPSSNTAPGVVRRQPNTLAPDRIGKSTRVMAPK